jgi:hypothetical protein
MNTTKKASRVQNAILQGSIGCGLGDGTAGGGGGAVGEGGGEFGSASNAMRVK